MDYNFVLIFCYYSLFIQPFENVLARRKPLEIIEDTMRVEKLAIDYVKYKQNWRSTILQPIKKLKKNICDQEPTVKLEFCQRLLPLASMEFEEYIRVSDLICTTREFWIRHPHNQETDSFEVKMYPCPDIKYRDLETDQYLTMSLKYYVSEGKKCRSAIVFSQYDKDSEDYKVHPKKYINNIVFKEFLYSLPKPIDRPFRPLRSFPRPDPDVEIVRYGESRETIRGPYKKFQVFFHSLNLCGLPKSHKIHICRVKLRDFYDAPNAIFKLEGYDQYKCKRRQLEPPTPKDAYYMKTGQYPPEEMYVYLLLCPPMGEPPYRKAIEPFHYLSSNLLPFSVSMLSRNNDWGEKFWWRAVYVDSDTHEMVQDRQLSRIMTYPFKSDRMKELNKLQRNYLKEFETQKNEAVTSVQTPVIIAKSGLVSSKGGRGAELLLPITRTEPLVEDSFILYAEVKAMKYVYRRFMKTYWSLDICELPHKLQKALCDHILHGLPFDYYPIFKEAEQSNKNPHSANIDSKDSSQMYIPPKRNINRACSRRSVNLGIREIDSLKARYYSTWQCPKAETSSVNTTVYHITKHYLKNALLLLKSCDACSDEDVLFPVAVVTDISRNALARIVLQKIIAH